MVSSLDCAFSSVPFEVALGRLACLQSWLLIPWICALSSWTASAPCCDFGAEYVIISFVNTMQVVRIAIVDFRFREVFRVILVNGALSGVESKQTVAAASTNY
jgi:hypothetical protein